jgi:hypothetical protein
LLLALRQELASMSPTRKRGRASVGGSRNDSAAQHLHHQRRRTINDRKRTMRKFIITAGAASVLALAVAGPASASVAVDDAGHGFVGKGDVQDVFGGWNNKQLQDNASKLKFTVNSTNVKVEADEWTCTKTTVTGNDTVKETVQERAVTTTTTSSTTALVNSIARVKNQITGFNMEGFKGEPIITSNSTLEGPAVDSCPDANSGFVFDADSASHTDISDVTTNNGLTVTDGISIFTRCRTRRSSRRSRR